MQGIGVTDLVGPKPSGGSSLLPIGKGKKSKAGNTNSEVPCQAKDGENLFLSVWKFEEILLAIEGECMTGRGNREPRC